MRSYSLDEAYLNVTQALAKRLDVAAEGAAATVTTTTSRAGSPGRLVANPPTFSFSDSTVSGDEKLSAGEQQSRGQTRLPRDGCAENMEKGQEEEGEGGDGVERDGSCRMPRKKRRERMFEAARFLAEEIRGRIRHETKLTASVGIGPNFMLAKVCLRVGRVCVARRCAWSLGGRT